MKKNDEYTVKIIDDTDMGAGVARVDNQVVFVPKALSDEEIKIQITKVNKKYAFGRIKEIIEPSPNRVDMECSYARLCGGCQLQHMKYQSQLEFKQRHVQSLFDHPVEPVLGMEEPWYYRNKAQFPVQVIDKDIKMGFYRVHSNDIVDCDQCMIQDTTINEIYRWLREHVSLKEARELRHILIRHSRFDECQVIFIGRKNVFRDISNTLVSSFSNIKSIVYNENLRNDNVILGDRYKVLFGRDWIMEECMGNKVKLHFKSFYQVNPKQMEVLYQTAIDFAKLDKRMTVVEMYAGTGTIGMAVSKYVDQVIGVEIVEDAVKNAKENCRINHIDNCEYVCQDATLFAHEMKEKQQKIDVLFVDPPRKGMTEQGIRDITTLSPDRVIYISCNPKTLARDIKVFEQENYRIEKIQPVDMFGHSTHIETIVALQKKHFDCGEIALDSN